MGSVVKPVSSHSCCFDGMSFTIQMPPVGRHSPPFESCTWLNLVWLLARNGKSNEVIVYSCPWGVFKHNCFDKFQHSDRKKIKFQFTEQIKWKETHTHTHTQTHELTVFLLCTKHFEENNTLIDRKYTRTHTFRGRQTGTHSTTLMGNWTKETELNETSSWCKRKWSFIVLAREWAKAHEIKFNAIPAKEPIFIET